MTGLPGKYVRLICDWLSREVCDLLSKEVCEANV